MENDDNQKPRRKVEISFIENKSRRQITFSKRKRGIMKKSFELSTLTGAPTLCIIASETGHVYTFMTPGFDQLVNNPAGRKLIQSCLNAPDVANI